MPKSYSSEIFPSFGFPLFFHRGNNLELHVRGLALHVITLWYSKIGCVELLKHANWPSTSSGKSNCPSSWKLVSLITWPRFRHRLEKKMTRRLIITKEWAVHSRRQMGGGGNQALLVDNSNELLLPFMSLVHTALVFSWLPPQTFRLCIKDWLPWLLR